MSNDNWMSSMAVPPLTQPDERTMPLDERLMILLETHMRAEDASLKAYQEMVDATGDSICSFVIKQILEDEEHHHRLQQQMIASLKRGLLGTPQPGVLPGRPVPAGVDLNALIETTKQRIKEEQTGIHELKVLAKQDKRVYSGLFSLLMETMAKDSEKHELMLKFLLKRLEAETRA